MFMFPLDKLQMFMTQVVISFQRFQMIPECVHTVAFESCFLYITLL